MSEKALKKWASTFEAIANPIRLAVLLILYGSKFLRHQSSLTFTEIRDILGIPERVGITYHLSKLLKAELISKEAHKDEEGRVYPLYCITTKGENLLRDIGVLEPLRQYIEMRLPKD